MTFSSDQRIRHAAYGNGNIVNSDEQRTVQLEATDEPAPARATRRSRKKAV